MQPGTNNNFLQRPSPQSTVSTPQTTSDKQQQTTTTDRHTRQPKPTPVNEQSTINRQLASHWISDIIVYKLGLDNDKPTQDHFCLTSNNRWQTMSQFLFEYVAHSPILPRFKDCVSLWTKNAAQAKIFCHTVQDFKVAFTSVERLVLCRRHPTKTEWYTGTKAKYCSTKGFKRREICLSLTNGAHQRLSTLYIVQLQWPEYKWAEIN